MSRLSRIVAILVPAMVMAACSTDQTADPEGLISRDTLPNGIVVVQYGALPVSDVVLAEVNLSLGEVEGDPNFIFGNVRGIEAGLDGTIYVLDYQAAEVRAFDAEGRFLRNVVSRGAGPGEITEANGMVLVGDNILTTASAATNTFQSASRAARTVSRTQACKYTPATISVSILS